MTKRGSHNLFRHTKPAITLAVAVLLLSFAARAATVSGLSDLVTRLQINVSADHEIKFVTPSGVDAPTDTITISFQSDYDLSTVGFADMDLAVDTDGTPGDCAGTFTDMTLTATPGLGSTWGAVVSGQILTLTPPTDAVLGQVAADSCIRVRIGKNAPVGSPDVTLNKQIKNPSTPVYHTITLGGGFGDSGTAYTLNNDSDLVTITATVAPAGGGGGGGGGGGCISTVFFNIRVQNITETTADILWDSDISSSSTVNYGPTVGYGSTASTPGNTFNHSVHLTGLTAGATYHFIVRSTVICGGETVSGDSSFTTPDTTAPVLSNIACSNVTGTSFTVSWDTNEDADSKVAYGFSEPYSNFIFNSALVNVHSMNVTGLAPNSIYRYRTTSNDASSNSSTSVEFTCQTIDTIAPVITNVSCDAVTNTSFRVNWTTNELADSKVDYGLTAAYGQAISSPAFVANHNTVVTPLASATTYHYKVTSKDASLNSAASTDFTCTTLGDTTPPSNVQTFTANACSGDVTLNWSNPGDGDFAGTKIQRSTVSSPANPGSGTTVYDASGNTTVDAGLTNGVTQFYTAFSYDTSGNFASGATANATPSATPSPFCPAAPSVCGNSMCETGETAANCPVDCAVPPSCYDCSRASYDVYIINPDLSERHMNTPWVQTQDLGNGMYRIMFEDATLNPLDPNFDYNDAVIDADTRDCSKVKFTFVSSEAGWDHKVRFKVFIDGVERSDTLLVNSTKSNVGSSVTVNAGAQLDAPMCPVPGLPIVCGNSLCESGETNASCPADCPAVIPPAVCGNAVCENGETTANCPADCPAVPPASVCGNSLCETGENNLNCAIDCPLPPVVPPPTTAANRIDQNQIKYFSLERLLMLHRDLEGFYRILPGRNFSVDIPDSALPQPVDSISLNFGSGSYIFSSTREGADAGQEWADVAAPGRVGTVSGSITLNYADGTSETVTFEVKIEPYGLIYYRDAGRKIPIDGASVRLQKEINPWIDWDATPYLQSNPLTTGGDGTYGFMAPQGNYKLLVDKEGYRPVETSPFDLTTEVIDTDIEMIPIPKPLTDLIVPGATIVENIGNVARGLGAQGSYIAKTFQNEFILNPTVKRATSQYVVPAAVIITTAVAVTAIQATSLISYLYFLLTQPILLLGKRRRKEYGTVYNSLTKRPVDLAIVRLLRTTTGKLVRTLVTDKQGRYAFLVDPGEYRIEASKVGYTFPTQYLKDKKEDAEYLDLYHGEVIRAGEKGAIITANIPLDPLEAVKTAKRLIWEEIGRKIQNVLALGSVILTAVAAAFYRQTYMYFLLALQIATFFLFRRLARPKQPKNWGIIYDVKTKKPIPFAVARIVETTYSKVLESRVTDSAGRYNFLVGNNKYVVTVEKPGYESSRSEEIDMTTKKGVGVVSKDIALKEKDKTAAPKIETPGPKPS